MNKVEQRGIKHNEKHNFCFKLQFTDQSITEQNTHSTGTTKLNDKHNFYFTLQSTERNSTEQNTLIHNESPRN